MDNGVSRLFALVRGCKDSSGLREFGFGRRFSSLLVALVLLFLIPQSAFVSVPPGPHTGHLTFLFNRRELASLNYSNVVYRVSPQVRGLRF
jgi:hypothetical protein